MKKKHWVVDGVNDVVITAREVIIIGTPAVVDDELDEHPHNCDTMGCGSSRGHVLLRFNHGDDIDASTFEDAGVGYREEGVR